MSDHKMAKIFEYSEPSLVGVHLEALAEHYQMSTNVPGVQTYSQSLALSPSFCFEQISDLQHKG